MAAVRWDKYHQELLIEKVKARNCLWDIRHPDYRNVAKKQALFEEITAEMETFRPGTSVEDVKKRWGNLRCQFSENIRASKGKDGSPDKPRKLWCKNNLMFLIAVTIPRSSKLRKISEVADGDITSGAESVAPELDPGSSCDVNSPESCCFSPIRSAINEKQQQKISPDCGLDPLSLSTLNTAPSSPNLLPPLRSHGQDAIDKYAHCVASELRQIRQPQQLVLAKWHIQNILFQAQFGMLVGPPATLAFSSAPAPYPQDTLNWQQSAPIQVITSDNEGAKNSTSP